MVLHIARIVNNFMYAYYLSQFLNLLLEKKELNLLLDNTDEDLYMYHDFPMQMLFRYSES